MDFLFLGTSAGVPTKSRNVTALALQEDQGKAWYLIDCGEATQHQLLHTKLSLHELQAIFITHVHGDHCYGLPGLLASAGMNQRKQPLVVVAPQGIEAWFKSTLENTQLYIPFDIQFIQAENLQNYSLRNFSISSTKLAHRTPSYAYRFQEREVESRLDTEKLKNAGIPSGPHWGELARGEDIEYNGIKLVAANYLLSENAPRKWVIGGDNETPALLAEACADCDVLVHEATCTKDVAEKKGSEFSHSAAASVAEFAERVGLRNLVLTHFSSRYHGTHNKRGSLEDIRKEAAAYYSGNLYLADDFARFRLSTKGEFTRVDKSE